MERCNKCRRSIMGTIAVCNFAHYHLNYSAIKPLTEMVDTMKENMKTYITDCIGKSNVIGVGSIKGYCAILNLKSTYEAMK